MISVRLHIFFFLFFFSASFCPFALVGNRPIEIGKSALPVSLEYARNRDGWKAGYNSNYNDDSRLTCIQASCDVILWLISISFLVFSLNLYMYLFFPVINSRKAGYCVSDSNMEAHAPSLTDVVLFYLLCACFNFPLSCVCAVLIYICFEQLAIALGT